MTDDALILRARGGDELAMRRILDRYEWLCRRIADQYFLPGGEPEDLRQEARYGLLKAVRDFDPTQRVWFRTFLSMCVQRQVITAIKTATRLKHRSLNEAVSLSERIMDGDGEDPALGDALPDRRQPEPPEILEIRDELDAVRRTVRGMSPAERAATIGIGSGNSYRQVAEATECSVKAIDNAQQRGQRKLREALEAAA